MPRLLPLLRREVERLRWEVSSQGRHGWTLWAWLRATLDRHLLRYETEHCQSCGRRVGLVWHCRDDATWTAATGNAHGGGLRCIRCFDRQARAAGSPVYWLAVHPTEYEPLGYPEAVREGAGISPVVGIARRTYGV